VEVLFYHLMGRSVEQALPQLLEKTLAKGWRAVVQVASPARLKVLDDHLWTYADASFLPHATDGEGKDAPIQLSLTDVRGEADVLFAVDGTAFPSTQGWQRIVILFDGRNEEALQQARLTWKNVKALGHAATYWQQDEQGGWAQKA
jgi:DNA polymerase III subunit chi